MAPLTIPISGHADLEVATCSGAIEIIAEQRDDLAIEKGARSASDVEVGDLGRVPKNAVNLSSFDARSEAISQRRPDPRRFDCADPSVA